MEGNNNNQNRNNVCEVCGSGNGRCNNCGHMCGFGSRHILRWVLGILIISWVFCIGMKIGELKSELMGGGYYSGYGNHMIRYGAMPMMYGTAGAYDDSNVTFTTSSVPSGTVKIIKQ